VTAAGTIPPGTVFVIGAGVAGLQAIATARRARRRRQGVRRPARGQGAGGEVSAPRSSRPKRLAADAEQKRAATRARRRTRSGSARPPRSQARSPRRPGDHTPRCPARRPGADHEEMVKAMKTGSGDRGPSRRSRAQLRAHGGGPGRGPAQRSISSARPTFRPPCRPTAARCTAARRGGGRSTS